MRKSLEYRLRFGLKVAQLDPNARVIYATGTVSKAKEAWQTIINMIGKPNGFTFNLQTFEAKHESGGFFKILPMESELHHYGGWQMTHVWLDETLPKASRDYISTRVRVSNSRPVHPEPSGIYDEWGVTRREDY